MTSRSFPFLCCTAAALLAIDSAWAQPAGAGKAVNRTCPISTEPIDGETFVTHGGKTIGFCCPGCTKAFTGWSEQRKDAFVLAAMRTEQSKPPTTGPTSRPAAAHDVKSDPYLLETCPVSGEPLGSMGDPVVKTIEGREVRFCCGGCIGRFEANTKKYFKQIDKAIAKRQMPFYPLETCVVSDESLTEDGDDIGVNYVYGNRLVRLCCRGCIREFNESPAKYFEKLDAAVIKAQRPDYPLADCAVREGSKLGSMGDPVEIVVANRLVKFCCAGCRPAFDKDPAPYLARLDKAWEPIHRAHAKQ